MEDWNERFEKMKSDLGLTNRDIAYEIGNTEESVRNVTQPNGQFPRWAKLSILVHEGKFKTRSKKRKNRIKLIEAENIPENDKLGYEVAKAFHSLFRKNLQDAGASTVQIDRADYITWINPIKLMYKIDGYTNEDFKKAFQFLKEDDFWKSNILSTGKLRKKMSTILLQINRNENGTKQRNTENTQRKAIEHLHSIDTGLR